MAAGDHLAWVKPKLNSPSKDKNYKIAADDLDADSDAIRAAVRSGSLVSLTDSMWKKISNTNSQSIKSLDDIRDYANQAGKKDKIDQHIVEFVLAKVKAPILLKISDGSFYRVTGETRLSIASFAGVQPKVWLASFP